MGKAWCVNGELDTTNYASPMPIVGLYIAIGTLVCFFSMAFDLLHGFIRRKPHLPCKLFPLNSFTLSILAVATKFSLDLNTPMPRAMDQFSKLTSNALLCISIGFFMPSLGTMTTSERYANTAALSIMAITVIVNVCIQLITGVIYAFTKEHVIILVCMSVLLLLLWSSTLAIKAQREMLLFRYRETKSSDNISAEDLESLRNILARSYVSRYCSNPQLTLSLNSDYHVVSLLCAITSATVLEAALRPLAIKELKFCNGISDYKWSIMLVVVTHILTILVGGFAIMYRGFIILYHKSVGEKRVSWEFVSPFFRTMELQQLRHYTLSFKALGKTANNITQVAQYFLIDVLIAIQIVVHWGSSLVLIPFYISKMFFAWVLTKMKIKGGLDICISHKHREDVKAMVHSLSDLEKYRMTFEVDDDFENWMKKIAVDDMVRWMKVNKRDSLTHLTQLLSTPITESLCSSMEGLRQTAANLIPRESGYEYRVSCVTVLALVGLTANLIPPLRNQSLIHSLYESFQIVYFVDQKTNTPSSGNELRWMAAKNVWVGWENPRHWFQKRVISPVFKNYSKKTSNDSSEQVQAQDGRAIIKTASDCITKKFGDINYCIEVITGDTWNPFHSREMPPRLMVLELLIICQFILEHEYASIDEFHDFLETTFVQMLRFFLSGLPVAIFKEFDGDLDEVSEERVKNALKFFCKLEMLGDNVQWSWPTDFDTKTKSQAQPLLCPASTSCTATDATDCKSKVHTTADAFNNGKTAAPLLSDVDEIIHVHGFSSNV